MSNNEKSSDSKILSILAERRVTPTPALDKIERYWNVVRANRLAPSRCEIDPRGLEGVLGNAFILERITGGLARFRIAGSHISDITGLELRQMPISALFMPKSRDILSEALTAVFEEPGIVRLRLESKGGFGRERMQGEMILLPLRSDLGQIDRVLGGIVMDGKIGRTPRRLDILGQSRKSLVGYAGPIHAETPVAPISEQPVTQVPTIARHTPVRAPETNSKTSYLKLVVDNS